MLPLHQAPRHAFVSKTMLISFLLILLTQISVNAQISLTMLPSGGNKKAGVYERVGLTDVHVYYDRPAVKGREGKIWGELVHKGFTDQGFGSSKAAPWRAGANENTVISFSTDVKINGQHLPKGKYGFFIAYDPESSILIFSKNHGSWGSYFYDPKEDALRVTVKPETLSSSVEWLQYSFRPLRNNKAELSLEWEKLRIPFTIEVDYIADQLESFRQELRTARGFTWMSWHQAANWCLQNNVNLEQALQWSDSATSINFGGNREFQTFVTKAAILEKLGRNDEAAALMRTALPMANMNEVHQYGRTLLQQKKNKEAMEIFQLNHKNHPKQFTTLVGLARGYSANGDLKNALKYAKQSLPLSPNEPNKKAVEGMIEKLSKGEPIE
jgi:tetratricopeptide (TPR) repeat protein